MLFVTDEDPRGQNVSLKSVFATQMLKKYLLSNLGEAEERTDCSYNILM